MKRFYKKAGFGKGNGSFFLTLDGKAVKTPAKAPLSVPTRKLAEACAREWQKQQETIDPASMPLNRLANTAIDRTRLNKGIVIEEFMNFARHDLLCYRAEAPEALKAAEHKTWQPYLDWAEKDLGIAFRVTTGIESIEQDPGSMARLQALLEVLDPFPLTALHNATNLSGSAVLALALWERFKSPNAIWAASHLDEDFQAGKWGKDSEAAKVRAQKKALWDATDRFLKALA